MKMTMSLLVLPPLTGLKVNYLFTIVILGLLKGCFGYDYDYNTEASLGNEAFDFVELEASTNTGQDPLIDMLDNIQYIENWIEECKTKTSSAEWETIQEAPERIANCVTKYIKFDLLNLEFEDSMDSGELHLVMKKYCGRREPILKCINDVLDTVKPCLSDQQDKDLNITQEAVNAGLDFTCNKAGEMMALFLVQDGEECLRNKSEIIVRDCLEKNLPQINELREDFKLVPLSKFMYIEENCRGLSLAHECIVSTMEMCSDRAPSSVLDLLVSQMLNATPCGRPNNAAPASSAFLPHLLALICVAVTVLQLLI